MARTARKPVVDPRSARRARLLMAVAALLFALFCLNVLLGKARVAFGLELPFLLRDVAEFLLLLLSALFFTLAALAREQAVGSRDAGNGGQR
jgi:heme A synthase